MDMEEQSQILLPEDRVQGYLWAKMWGKVIRGKLRADEVDQVLEGLFRN